MSLSEFLALWMDTYIRPNRANNTVRAYQFALAHLSPEILCEDLTELEPIRIQQNVNQVAAEYPRQAQLMFTALRAALKRAERLQMISCNPMGLIDPPEHRPARAEYLREDEAAAYIREAEHAQAGALLILMLCLGLRRNEARGLKNGDLDEDGVLHIRWQRDRSGNLVQLKSDASRRDIPVPEGLRRFFRGNPEEYLVDVSEKSLRTQHRRTLSAIGCTRRVTLHGLRHSCATLALANGVQLAQITKLLGHAHYSLTADLYAHADLVMLQHCTNVIFGSFRSPFVQQGARLEIV